jgi:hypothetical protein
VAEDAVAREAEAQANEEQDERHAAADEERHALAPLYHGTI